MFYLSDILRKRGKFGLIWLASTKAKRLHRRQICSVDIMEASEDIMDVLNTHHLAGISRKVCFSLYLSSQLVSGLVYIADMQTRFLLEDLKAIVLRLGDSKKPDIDLNKTLCKSKVTLKEFDMDGALLDFGCFNPSPEPSHHHYDQYFLITTPKSSETSLDISAYEVPRLEENSIHLARKEDITLADAVPFRSEEPIPELEEIVDLLAPPLPFIHPSTGIERSLNIQTDDALPSPYNIERAIFMTPETAEEEEQLAPLMPVLSSEQMAANESPYCPPPTVRRRRKRRLVVDAVTSLTSDQIKKNISSASSTRHLVIPSTVESAMSLMTRLGSGFLAPKSTLMRLKLLKTKEDVSREEVELTSPVESHISVSEFIEHERNKTKDPSGSGFMKSASIKTLEASSTLSATIRVEENLKSPSHFIQEDDYEIDPVVEPLIAEARFSTSLFDAPDLVPEMDDQQPDRNNLLDQMAEKRKQQECLVSPERTPPPSSYHSLHEILDQAFELLLKTVEASIIPNYTTFSAMLVKSDVTKKRVASLFFSLLCLHAEGKIIIQQPITGAEIFIEIQS